MEDTGFMARYLVIVESPAKVKTIKKFLGKNYVVTASNGHVRDLPKSQMGVDVEHDFEPKYITIRGKGELLAGLRKEVKKADKVYLATDPDREGEAISWHLSKALNLEDKKTYRISFNEITKNAVKESLKNARDIDMDLVDAQQARRVLDRIVGYKISPLLWAKVKAGTERRSCPVSSSADHRGPGRGDQRLHPGRILDPGRPAESARRAQERDCQILRHRGQEDDHFLKGGTGPDPGRDSGCLLLCGGCKKRRTDQKDTGALYHQHFAAGGIQGAELRHGQDHADRPAAL